MVQPTHLFEAFADFIFGFGKGDEFGKQMGFVSVHAHVAPRLDGAAVGIAGKRMAAAIRGFVGKGIGTRFSIARLGRRDEGADLDFVA